MEMFLQLRFQIPLHHRLSDSIGKRWECPTACFRLLACRCALASPAAESSCPTTSDSRACTDCFSNLPQTPQSIGRPHRLLPGSPLPVYRHPKPIAWECSTTLLCPKGLLPFPVDLSVKLNDVAPWLQSRYRTFIATTRNSVPALRLGTPALAGRPLEFLPSHRCAGSHVPHKSLDRVHAAFVPDAD